MGSTDFKPDRVVPLTDSFEVGSKGVCDYCINDDQVTDLHAVVERKKGRTTIRDRGSRTGTLVNGRPITEARLEAGDWISIGPTMFQFTGEELAVYPRGRMYRIDGVGLNRAVPVVPEGGGPAVPLVLISDVTVTVEPGEFTAIIGPSGSGKSTLLNALSARVPADAGTVSVNGQNLISHFEQMKRSIVLVPQRETIHEPLTVRAILTHTARLRMPAGTSTTALAREVTRVLGVVDLPEEQHATAFGTLSGGQKKRVCLANELIGNPQVVFLDEVTSGLDEEGDGRMMALFRKLADGGKTVICITHNLANVERYCTRVVVLARGGRLAFCGPAADALDYFAVTRLGDVYRRLEQDDPPDADGQPVADGQPGAGGLTGKAAKAEAWRLAYERLPQRRADRDQITGRPAADAASPAGAPAGRVDDDSPARRLVSQTAALVRRYVDLQLLDRPNLLSLAGTSVMVAALLILAFGNVNVGDPAGLRTAAVVKGPMLMFLVLFLSMWFGCNNAAKEVVKEADIYRMERNHSLDLTAYYLSKLSVLTVMSVAQAALLFVPVRLLCQPDGAVLYQAFMVVAVTFVGVALGLVISAAVRTVDVAATLVPVAIIPQFVLAGAVAKLSGLASLLGVGMALNWGYKGMLGCEPAFIRDATDAPAFLPSVVMLGLHAAVYVAAGWALLRMKDKGQTTGDLIRLTRRAMRDPNGPAARYLATAKSLASTSAKRFVVDRDLGHVPLPGLRPRRPAATGLPLPPPVRLQPPPAEVPPARPAPQRVPVVTASQPVPPPPRPMATPPPRPTSPAVGRPTATSTAKTDPKV